MGDWINQLSENTRIALVGIFAVTLVLLIELKPWVPSAIGLSEQELLLLARDADSLPVPPESLVSPHLDARLLAKTTKSIKEIDPELEILMENREFGVLTDRLLNLAAQAVTDNQTGQLVEILSLLGQVSIERQILDVAEVYLFEALDLLSETDHDAARAEIYMQLGRTYMKSREIARSAGYAYDALQIGRNQLYRGRYQQAEQSILTAIEHSLSINRFNAAASAYSSLAHLHLRTGNQFESERARLEAARLYSSSGQVTPAQKELELLRTAGIDEWRLFGLEQEIDENYGSYRESIEQIAVARDYQRLYHHFLSQKNFARAWHFRLLASKSLENVSKRAMFHRQQGVLALLYNSNDSMVLAKNYFSEASRSFSTEGMDAQNQQTMELSKKVW